MGIVADLRLAAMRIRRGGGQLWIVEYDPAKAPYFMHSTIKETGLIGQTSLTCFTANAADWGTTGTVRIDIIPDGWQTTKNYTNLTGNVFTLSTGLDHDVTRGMIVKKHLATDYAVNAWKHIGHLAQEGTGFGDKQSVEPVFNEKNDAVSSGVGSRAIEVIPILLQTSKTEFDFLLTEGRDKLFAIKYVAPIVAQGSQIWVAKRCRILVDADVRFGGAVTRTVPATIEILKEGTYEPYVVYEG